MTIDFFSLQKKVFWVSVTQVNGKNTIKMSGSLCVSNADI